MMNVMNVVVVRFREKMLGLFFEMREHVTERIAAHEIVPIHDC
jgi:hypothetical protein